MGKTKHNHSIIQIIMTFTNASLFWSMAIGSGAKMSTTLYMFYVFKGKGVTEKILQRNFMIPSLENFPV